MRQYNYATQWINELTYVFKREKTEGRGIAWEQQIKHRPQNNIVDWPEAQKYSAYKVEGKYVVSWCPFCEHSDWTI